MSEFINFLSAISRDTLPAGKIGGILANTPSILKSPSELKKTQELFNKSQAKYTMVDSGGFQLFKIDRDNQEIQDPSLRIQVIMNPDKPIYQKGKFNLVSEHVLAAVQALNPDFVISPDWPVRKPKIPDESRFLFLRSIGYNLYSAWQLSLLLDQSGCKAKLLIPVQAYNLEEVQLYSIHLNKFRFDGLSFPSRIMTPERMAAFFIKAHISGIRRIHLLGTNKFSSLALAAYFARHFFEFTSLDSSDLAYFSLVNSYLMPYSLKALSLRRNSRDDLSQPITCSCEFCSYEKSFKAIQSRGTDEKRNFVVNHNHLVIQQMMREAYEHASTASELYEFLMEKAPQNEDCGEVFRILSLVEAMRPFLEDPDLVSAFYAKLGF